MAHTARSDVMSKTHEANMWGAKLTLLLTQLSSDRRSGQERKKSRLLLAKNLQTQRNNAWHRHSMDKKNVLCAATNDYLPVEQEQDSGHCHLKGQHC
jgi:hypothetical protein